jgi:molybdate transport system regulatory protein
MLRGISMENSKETLEYGLDLWLNIRGKPILLNNKKFHLLKYIEKYGSISKASEMAKIPYRTSHKYLEQLENEIGSSLIDTQRGGKGGGGGSQLTETGKSVLWEYTKIMSILKKHWEVNEIEGTVSDFDEESKIMKINLTDKQIVLPLMKNLEIGDRVLVMVSPEDIFVMLEPHESSVRNLFEAKIIGMELQNQMIRLTVNLDGFKVFADITEYSREKLDLKLGKNVYVGFKATSMPVIKL